MKIVYGSKDVRKNQTPFTKEETASQPLVSDIPSDGCYTLVMVDPDAGGTVNGHRPGNADRYYLHWIVVNISGGNLMSGDPIVPYKGPTPPPGTGRNKRHEYIFYLYEQPCGLTNGLTVKNRPNWSLQQFLQGKNLELVESKSFFVPSA